MKKIGQVLKSEEKYSWVKMEKGTSCGEEKCPFPLHSSMTLRVIFM